MLKTPNCDGRHFFVVWLGDRVQALKFSLSKGANHMRTSKAEYRRRALKAWRTKRRNAKKRRKK
jgi:hypothetical protein